MSQQFPNGTLVRVCNRKDGWNGAMGEVVKYVAPFYHVKVTSTTLKSNIGMVCGFHEAQLSAAHDGQSSSESNPTSPSETVQQSNSETKRIIKPKCPACGLEHEKNYVGFQVIECQNWQCKWFKW